MTTTPLERGRQLAEAAAAPLREVEKTTAARTKAEEKLAAADTAWRKSLKAATEAGAPVADVAAAAKVHRTRVWQIVTGKGPRRRTAAAAQ